MPLNCKVGDLAVVISEEPGCEDNIGRIVKVLKATTVEDSASTWWFIQPVDQEPWNCMELVQDGKYFEVFQYSGAVCIEDQCLRPIRGLRPKARAKSSPAAKVSRKKSSTVI